MMRDDSWPTFWLAMNPRYWERGHQIGLGIAITLGFVAGFLAARAFVDASHFAHRFYYGHYSWESINLYWPLILVWAICGALIAAAIVYMVRLLRD